MSVLLVSRIHIDAMLTAGLRLVPPSMPLTWHWSPDGTEIAVRAHQLTPETATRVGAMLYAVNAASVNGDQGAEMPPLPAYAFKALPGYPDPVQVLKAVNCYRYQSDEAPGWADSEASAFCRILETRAVEALRGYADAEWLIQDPRIYLRTGKGATAPGDLLDRVQRYGDARENGRGAADELSGIEALLSPWS